MLQDRVWHYKGDSVQAPQAPISMPPCLWTALYNRGYKTQVEIEKIFSPSLSDLKNPFSLKDMEKSVKRILTALEKNETIAIYADFDLDGTSGLCLLYEGLTALGFQKLIYYQPKRLSEGYGLHSHAVEDLKNQGVDLIISIDVGITALDAAIKSKELDIDLIITDHHLPYENLPDAYAIINPNTKECSSGLGYLSGAGVAFYLLLAVRAALKKQGNTLAENFNPKAVLDFFIIGTITDLVPLINENRILVKHGLSVLANTQRAGLKALMQVLNLQGRLLTSEEVAIQLAPKLNALSRMESDILPRDILLEKDEQKAQSLVGFVLKTQDLRKKLQKFAQKRAEELMQEMNQSSYIWVWSEEFHKGVIGLVATYLAEKYSVPAFVGAVNEEGLISGSCRIPPGKNFDLTRALTFCKEVLTKHGGHAQAAGFALQLEQTILFDEKLAEYCASKSIEKEVKSLEYDAEATLEDISSKFMNWYSSLEPFGKDFAPIIFRFKNCVVKDLKIMNGGHLRVYWQQDLRVIESVIFSPQDKFKEISIGNRYDILAEPKWNHYNGRSTLQLSVKDILKNTI